MRNKISRLAGRQLVVLLALLASTPTARANGNDCPAILPADAVAIGELRLCSVSSDSPDGLSVCRTYEAGGHAFQIEFRGGVVPVAARRLTVASMQGEASLTSATVVEVAKRRCDLTRPAGVPRMVVECGLARVSTRILIGCASALRIGASPARPGALGTLGWAGEDRCILNAPIIGDVPARVKQERRARAPPLRLQAPASRWYLSGDERHVSWKTTVTV